MSVHQLPLPSPPPDIPLIGPMSGLFARSLSTQVDSDDPLDASTSDLEAVARKRVEFHPWTTNISEKHLSTPDSEVAPSLKSLPPSRDCQLSTRPILKPTQSSEFLLGLDGQEDTITAFEKMDSLLQNLGRNDRSSSVDAYQTMTSLIRMYDEPPEYEILQTKMTQLQAYIKRDLVVLDKSVDDLPSEERLSMGNLVMSALKVLVTMVWSPVYSPCLSDAFRQWAIDRSIQVLKEHSAPKAILLHYMHLLATQGFSTRLMTSSNRAARIVEVLQELTDHVSGKAVVAERLLVYQKLIDQAKPIMEKKIDMWMKNLLSAMAHSFKEIRSNAISAGTKACSAFAANPAIPTAARQSLAEMTGERTLSASMTNRLERVLAAKDEANQIPQIWTIVLMLCNGKNNKLDSWPQLHEWLKLIQKCFNCSDSTVRVQAFMAWNRLYFVAKPSEASEKVVSMLAKPAINQLDKTGNNVSGKGTRQAVISSYCMLLYYAFRPSSTPQQYTRMWNEFVVKLMTRSFLAKSSANCDLCCRVLAALFHSSLSTSRVWNENRAHENAPLDPLELPAIDSKWTRSHISSILSVVRLLVEYSSFGPNGIISEQSYIAQTWRHLMRAVRDSSSKEIVASADSKSALQSILDFLEPQPTNQEIISDESIDPLRRNLLAKIAIAELSPGTILHALESSVGWRVGPLLKELVLSLSSFSDDIEVVQTHQRPSLTKCFDIIGEDLGRLVDLSSSMNTILRNTILGSVTLCVQAVPPFEIIDLLAGLQDRIIPLIEDSPKHHQDASSHSADQSSHKKFCSAMVNHLTAIDVSEYQRLDALLSSCISMQHADIRECLLSAKGRKFWTSNRGAFGSKVLGALKALPKLPTISQNEQGQGLQPQSPKPKNSFAAKMKKQLPHGRPRHDDSQVDFIPVHSSPPDYENFESQLLTTRQKEVRHRQNTERTLTFADIRSSPSARKGRKEVDEMMNTGAASPDRQTTPVLLQQRAQDDECQPPTPTPKTRRSLRNQLQPDVPEIPSSPPSAVGKQAQSGKAVAITSSPVKETNDLDGLVRLDVGEGDFVPTDGLLERNLPNADDDFEVPPTAPYNNQGERLGSPKLLVTDIQGSNPQSAFDEYETAELEVASPESFSDEYDALAASQLSQSLVEESNSVTNSMENRVSTASKRKRGGDSDTISMKSKKRRSVVPPNPQTLGVKDRETEEAKEVGDCIVVNTDYSNSRPNSRGKSVLKQTELRTNTRTGSPAPSLASQKSIASSPSSQHSTSKRRRRPNRKTRSQNSQETSPVTHVPTTEIYSDLGGKEKEVVNFMEEQDISQPEPLSLASEVKETNEDERCLSSHEQPTKTIAADLTYINMNLSEATKRRNTMFTATVQMNTSTSTEAISSSTQEQHSHTDSDTVRSLRHILDTLDQQSSGHGNPVDLAAIHSLCFQIGLKAQQLAQR